MTNIGRKPIVFGGVIVDESQIKSKKVVDEIGGPKYIIEFKTGVKAEYFNQDMSKGAFLNSFPNENNHLYVDKYMYTNGANIDSLRLDGSNDMDYINLRNCNGTVHSCFDKYIDSVECGNMANLEDYKK